MEENIIVNRAWVADQVKHIESIKDDDEAAHSEEDNVYLAILESIASGAISADEAKECCRVAIETQKITFSRWCA